MFKHISEDIDRRDKFMDEEQFEEIVEAILAGQYSWACVLILRAGGYNPLHYIPYRTYNRLIKNHCLGQGKEDQNHKADQSQEFSNTKSSGTYLH